MDASWRLSRCYCHGTLHEPSLHYETSYEKKVNAMGARCPIAPMLNVLNVYGVHSATGTPKPLAQHNCLLEKAGRALNPSILSSTFFSCLLNHRTSLNFSSSTSTQLHLAIMKLTQITLALTAVLSTAAAQGLASLPPCAVRGCSNTLQVMKTWTIY